MNLIKDLGIKSNLSGNKYRVGLYQCPKCKTKTELYTHNVKIQLKKSNLSKKPAVCVKCTLVLRNTTHNKSKTPAYKKWKAMISRCTKPYYPNYKRWGGRGITVCKEWMESFEVFEKWFLQQHYEKSYELDRINNNGNYTPENCRLIPKYKNARNREDSAKKHSKYRYVIWDKNRNKWYVNVPVPNIKGKRKYLGLFTCEEEAQKAIKKFNNSFDNSLDGWLDRD